MKNLKNIAKKYKEAFVKKVTRLSVQKIPNKNI